MESLHSAIGTVRAVQSRCADSLTLLLEAVGERGGDDGLITFDA